MMTWLIMELERNIKLFLCNTWKVTAHRFGTKWWYVVNYTIFIVGELFIKFFLTVVLFPVQNLLFVKSVQNISESWQKHHLWYYDPLPKEKRGTTRVQREKMKEKSTCVSDLPRVNESDNPMIHATSFLFFMCSGIGWAQAIMAF